MRASRRRPQPHSSNRKSQQRYRGIILRVANSLGYLQFTRPLRPGVLFVVDSSSSFVYSRRRATIKRNRFRHTARSLPLYLCLSLLSSYARLARAYKSFASNFRQFATHCLCPRRSRHRRISITAIIATSCAYFRVRYFRETVSARFQPRADKTGRIFPLETALVLRTLLLPFLFLFLIVSLAILAWAYLLMRARAQSRKFFVLAI